MGFHHDHMGYDFTKDKYAGGMNDDNEDDKAASRIVERILWE